MSLSPAAIREIASLTREADVLLSAAQVTRSDAKRADLIMSSISAIRRA